MFPDVYLFFQPFLNFFRGFFYGNLRKTWCGIAFGAGPASASGAGRIGTEKEIAFSERMPLFRRQIVRGTDHRTGNSGRRRQMGSPRVISDITVATPQKRDCPAQGTAIRITGKNASAAGNQLFRILSFTFPSRIKRNEVHPETQDGNQGGIMFQRPFCTLLSAADSEAAAFSIGVEEKSNASGGTSMPSRFKHSRYAWCRGSTCISGSRKLCRTGAR